MKPKQEKQTVLAAGPAGRWSVLACVPTLERGNESTYSAAIASQFFLASNNSRLSRVGIAEGVAWQLKTPQFQS